MKFVCTSTFGVALSIYKVSTNCILLKTRLGTLQILLHPICRCLSNGTWFTHPESGHEWSNYTNCVDVGDFEVDTGESARICILQR